MSVQDQSTSRPEVSVSGVPPEWTPPTGEVAQEQPVGRHRAKLAVAGALVVAVAATAGITAAVVGSGDGTSAAATGGPGGGQGFGGGGQGLPGGMTGGRGGAAASLHGTSVVSDGNGGYVTQETQTGTVSAVSASSITVKSEDGYSKTYVIGSATSVDNGADTIADVAAGHTVRVVATTSGDTATATTVTDTDLATTTDQQGGTQQGGPAGGAPAPGGQPDGTAQQNGTTAGGTVTGT